MYASWAKAENVDLKVFFGSSLGASKYIDASFGKEIKWDNLYLEEFNHIFLNGDNPIIPTSNLDAPNLDNELSNFKPDVLVHYGYFHKIAKRAKAWAKKNSVAIAYISDSERRRNRPIWKEVLKYPLVYYHFRDINIFLSVGEANEEYYKFYGVPQKKIIRMMFSIDVRTFEEAYNQLLATRKEFRQLYHIKENEIVISTVGKLLEFKSQNHIIEVLKILEEKFAEKTFHLLIAGSGSEEEKWKQLASNSLKKNKAHFLGFVNPNQLPKIYAASDIYVHPSEYDAHSLSISEAIYMGCPIITTNKTGSWGKNDDVQFDYNGFVYEYGDLKGLAQFIINLTDNELRRKFSSNSRKIGLDFQELSHKQILEKIKLHLSKNLDC